MHDLSDNKLWIRHNTQHNTDYWLLTDQTQANKHLSRITWFDLVMCYTIVFVLIEHVQGFCSRSILSDL